MTTLARIDENGVYKQPAGQGAVIHLKYKTARALKKAVDKYFKIKDEEKKPYTIIGLARALGVDWHTLSNYEDNPILSPIVKEARARIGERYEERLSGVNQVAGSIFALKNISKWQDTTTQQYQDGSGNIVNPIVLLPTRSKDDAEGVKTEQGDKIQGELKDITPEQ